MSRRNVFDPSIEPALIVMEDMCNAVWDDMEVDLSLGYKPYPWFWKEIVKHKLLKYLELAHDDILALSAESLLYAYTYPGTREALIRLAHGIYGSHSLIFIEDDKRPAVLSITIENANENFLLSLAKDKEIVLTTEDKRYVIAMWDLQRLVFHDTRLFFTQFITPGRILERVTVEVA